MADAPRARRMAGRIKQIVATVIETQIKDPRLGMVTITDVRVSGDLHEATLFYTVLGTDEERADSAVALESAKGVLRSEVGRQTGVRFTPTLAFSLDSVPDTAKQIEELLAAAREADAQVEAARRSAVPAGEADPYRKPRVIEDDDTDDTDDDTDDTDTDDGAIDDPDGDA
jgi:ribosome-binding factor A